MMQLISLVWPGELLELPGKDLVGAGNPLLCPNSVSTSLPSSAFCLCHIWFTKPTTSFSLLPFTYTQAAVIVFLLWLMLWLCFLSKLPRKLNKETLLPYYDHIRTDVQSVILPQDGWAVFLKKREDSLGASITKWTCVSPSVRSL